ncbi:hypothetical protein G7Z17_g13382 [Cylindrodendrum hubeiense]|uniref:Uncharacterized protein n=1 Tax=Cylindrodendrum hubeiense TaxID=595255 RepID=A0A9P5GTS1_9HYPO|nr:hypothetical protein G7Z17_g13382 [Cylindrodendrum hubeiense]
MNPFQSTTQPAGPDPSAETKIDATAVETEPAGSDHSAETKTDTTSDPLVNIKMEAAPLETLPGAYWQPALILINGTLVGGFINHRIRYVGSGKAPALHLITSLSTAKYHKQALLSSSHNLFRDAVYLNHYLKQ